MFLSKIFTIFKSEKEKTMLKRVILAILVSVLAASCCKVEVIGNENSFNFYSVSDTWYSTDSTCRTKSVFEVGTFIQGESTLRVFVKNYVDVKEGIRWRRIVGDVEGEGETRITMTPLEFQLELERVRKEVRFDDSVVFPKGNKNPKGCEISWSMFDKIYANCHNPKRDEDYK